MKNLILKTVAITLGAIVLCCLLLLAILSFAAPKVMMDFTASMGMDSASASFAYAEYERSGNLNCLARSFLIAEVCGDDETALERWEVLYGNENFSAYCEENAPDLEELPAYRYRDYLTGCASKLKYRLAETDAEKAEVLNFALSETLSSFPQGNPMIALSAQAASAEDVGFAETLLNALNGSDFEHNNDFLRLTETLEEIVHA